jgi:hypothetical protein
VRAGPSGVIFLFTVPPDPMLRVIFCSTAVTPARKKRFPVLRRGGRTARGLIPG